MFKNAIILVLVLLLASAAFSVRLIDPISRELAPENNFVGTVAPGNTIELIFSKELVSPYESLSIVNPLQSGITVDTQYDKESIKLFISVPANAPAGDYSFSVRLMGNGRDDTVGLYFTVVLGALAVSPSSAAVVEVPVGSPADYRFFFVNNTDSDASFTVHTSLPANWTKADLFAVSSSDRVVVVQKHQSVEESITVYPRLQGKRDFSAVVSFEGVNSKNFSFSINGLPTLNGKLSAVSLGLPFYSFSLLPAYFVNGLASFVFK